jgi:hypothetical protein
MLEFQRRDEERGMERETERRGEEKRLFQPPLVISAVEGFFYAGSDLNL